jgi:hypothetical protein
VAPAPKLAATSAELARLAGVSVNTWSSHVALGCPVPKRKRDLPTWLTQYAAWRIANGKVPPTERKVHADPEALQWQRERTKWAALEKKVAVGLLVRRLVERAEVERRSVQQILAVRQSLNGMVRKMSARLFNAPSPEWIEQELQTEVDYILEGFAEGMERVADIDEAPAAGEDADDDGSRDPTAEDGDVDEART